MKLERLALAVVLPMSSLIGVVPVGVLFSTDVSEHVVNRLAVAMLPVGIAVGALLAPRVFRTAALYSFPRRFFAGVLGLAAAIVMAWGVDTIGIVSDALSHVRPHPTPTEGLKAIAHEATTMILFYGSLWLVAFAVLGGPPNKAYLDSSVKRIPSSSSSVRR